MVMSRIAHRACVTLARGGYHRFKKALEDVETTQQAVFARQMKLSATTEVGTRHGITPDISLKQFQERVPVTEYEDWREYVERQREAGGRVISGMDCQRYQPTSGSTSRMKWIPYTQAFLDELDDALEPWMMDLYRLEPRLRSGRHYWSISWVPSSLRNQIDRNVNDDMALLPWSKRVFISLTSAVPPWVAYAPTSEASMFASLCQLAACDDLSFITVWSPTFALNLLNELSAQRDAVAEALESGRWDDHARGFEDRPCPRNRTAAARLKAWDGKLDSAFFSELWPRLGLISAWDTSSSAAWARKLHSYFPDATFQGKGLWATEGVVTIPFEGAYPLAVRSHFYEFMDLNTEEVLPAWRLREGQEVRPVLTTGSGFLRYALRDRMAVSGYVGSCPSFTFLGRLDGTDMVGEKLSPDIAMAAMTVATGSERALRPLTLMGVQEPTDGAPFYLLLCEGPEDAGADAMRAERAERHLRGSFHYNLARDLGQLGPVQCLTRPDALQLYQLRAAFKGMVAGNMKVEPLFLWNGELPRAISQPLREREGQSACVDISRVV